VPQRRTISQEQMDEYWADCLKGTDLSPRFARSARPWEEVRNVPASISYAVKHEAIEALLLDPDLFLQYEEQTRHKRMRMAFRYKGGERESRLIPNFKRRRMPSIVKGFCGTTNREAPTTTAQCLIVTTIALKRFGHDRVAEAKNSYNDRVIHASMVAAWRDGAFRVIVRNYCLFAGRTPSQKRPGKT
jgi:hypothetical protein